MHFIANHFGPFLTTARVYKLYVNKIVLSSISTVIISLTEYEKSIRIINYLSSFLTTKMNKKLWLIGTYLPDTNKTVSIH